MSFDRTIEHEIVVPGTPEQVWQAIATGQGITGWFVPTRVEEQVGGTFELDFGPGMGTTTGEVTRWQPPSQFGHSGSGGTGAPVAYLWQVEARDGGTCLVRLVTSGFLSEADWQAEYDSTSEGWQLFLNNLRLYLTYFPGQRCTSLMVQRLSDDTPDNAWRALTTSLGLPHAPSVGQAVSVTSGPPLAGRVERFAAGLMTLLLEAPARGVAVIGTESFGDKAFPMLYLYLFGAEAEALVARDAPAWNAWLERTFTFAEPDPEPPRT
jgi:uncharacterized protein YndB with AHSA1/START domain